MKCYVSQQLLRKFVQWYIAAECLITSMGLLASSRMVCELLNTTQKVAWLLFSVRKLSPHISEYGTDMPSNMSCWGRCNIRCRTSSSFLTVSYSNQFNFQQLICKHLATEGSDSCTSRDKSSKHHHIEAVGSRQKSSSLNTRYVNKSC